jgi:hypothetical protein
VGSSNSSADDAPIEIEPWVGPVVLNGLLALLSGFVALGHVLQHLPRDALCFGGLGLLSIVCLFLRTGWTVPCMIAGVYGAFILTPAMAGNLLAATIVEVRIVACGTSLGLVLGVILDVTRTHNRADKPPSDVDSSLPG